MYKAVLIVAALVATAPALAQEDPHARDREVLRGMLKKVEAALNARDLGPALPLLADEVVVTYQNAEVTRGREEARRYFARMLEGAAAVVKDFRTVAHVSAPAVFYGDTAVAYGTTEETYALAEGLAFTLNANWSATVVRQEGEWKLAALHFSTNLFDNPLLNNAERLVWVAGAIGLAAGLVLGVGGCWLRRRA